MSGLSPDPVGEARRWLGEAAEELAVAEVLAGDTRLPARAACFHAHLAAEKALKGLLIARAVVVKRSHDLAYLRGLLDPVDSDRFDVDDLAALNPWTIEGRYPADLADSAAGEVKALVDAARRVVALVERALPAP